MKLPVDLMKRFASETGLNNNHPPDRYLWTDAFAVCTYLGLYQSIGGRQYLDYALHLVDQVHEVLGQYHPEDSRTGWIASKSHPTAAGLRIGKKLVERKPDEEVNSVLEWQRDGQYFHYLTRWMYALVRVYEVTSNSQYIEFARDLAKASMKFVDGSRMYWKMSTDLSYPLVDSMGKHDPLDGYITLLGVNSYLKNGDLNEEVDILYNLTSEVDMRTTDTLGLGGLLMDYHRLATIDLSYNLLEDMERGIEWGLRNVDLMHNLAFRELGLSLGLYTSKKYDIFSDYLYFRDEIHRYWQPRSDFSEHRQINTVMLASSLHPIGYYKN